MKRISVKIVSAIVTSVLIVGVSIGALSLNRASHILQEESYEKFEYISRDYANEMSIKLSGVENTINTIASDIRINYNHEAFSSDDRYRENFMDKYGALIKNIGEVNPTIQGIYLVISPEITNSVYEQWYIYDSQGTFVYQEPEELAEFYPENEAMGWYYDPIQTDEGVWSLPYVDATINVKMISYTKAIYSGSQLIGVVGIDISFDEIIKSIEGMVFYDKGYAILLDDAYNVIIHPELLEGTNLLDIENENLQAVIESMEGSETGFDLYHYKDAEKIMGYSRMVNGWIFMVVTEIEEIHQPVIELRRNIFVVVAVMVIIAILIGLKMAKSFTTPLNRLHNLTDQIGEGDYDIQIDWSKNDELGTLARSFYSMSRKIESTQKELIALNSNMEFMAYHDPLTHLGNRRNGQIKIEEIVTCNQGGGGICGIMSIDLDNFKTINDTLGHDVGDEMLIHVSEMMSHNISNNDLLFRFGGDEFILLFKSVPTIELVEKLAERLVTAVRTPLMLHQDSISTSCSIGIVIVDDEIKNAEQLLKRADIVMYAAKQNGGNMYLHYKTIE